MLNSTLRLVPTALFSFTLIIAYLVYLPGLSGDFLFDDIANISRLSELHSSPQTDALLDYINNRRIISFISFLIDDYAWPSKAENFLYTNLMLHLLCGCLLAWLSYRISLLLHRPHIQAEWIATLSCLLWLIHPLFVSTTLYIVQRMTILSTLFCLAALLCYFYSRQAIYESKTKGYYLLYFGVGSFSLLAVFSKEIGALIPAYLLLFEKTLFPCKKIKTPLYQFWSYSYIYIPILLLLCLLIYMFFSDLYLVRTFNAYERLLTESRVLLQYFSLILIPETNSYGLFYDNYPISHSLITPWTTLFSILIIITLITAALVLKQKHPVISIAILFFFSGHLLESTTIGLEIYFEHRNYLPSIFLFIALAFYLVVFYQSSKIIAILLTLLIVFSYSITTYQRAGIWGEPLKLISKSIHTNQGSSRVYQEGIRLAIKNKQFDMEEYFHQQGLKANPDNIPLLTYQLLKDCKNKTKESKSLDSLKTTLQTSSELKTKYVFVDLKKILAHISTCPHLSPVQFKELLRMAHLNPNAIASLERQQELLYLEGLLAYKVKNYQQALHYFNESVVRRPFHNYILHQSLLLGNAGEYRLALQHLQQGKTILYMHESYPFPWSNNKINYLLELEQKLIQKLRSKKQT